MLWLHLTDLHAKASNQPQQIAFSSLIDAIQKNIGNQQFDAVFITGDLAYSGKRSEYEVVRDLILNPLKDDSRFQSASFIAVPGNHDLDINIDRPIVWSSLGATRQENFFNFDEVGKGIRDARAQGFAEYSRFILSNGLLGNDPISAPGSRHSIATQAGGTVTCICVNTSFFSDTEHEDDQLSPAPTPTLRYLIEKADLTKPLLVLGHHPIEYFEEESRAPFRRILQEHNAVYLHGHTHQISAHHSANAVLSLGFGAGNVSSLDSKPDPRYENTFAVAQIQGNLHVAFYSWDAKNGAWIIENRVPPEFDRPSNIFNAGYELTLPSKKREDTTTVEKSMVSETLRARATVETPIWLDAQPKEGWMAVLKQTGYLQQYTNVEQLQNPDRPTSHHEFLIEDAAGRHILRTVSATSDSLTYDQVVETNTYIDVNALHSGIIITFGKVSESASKLAKKLRARKALIVIDGAELAKQFSRHPILPEIRQKNGLNDEPVSFIPAITKIGTCFVIKDSVQGHWFSIISPTGELLSASDEIVYIVRRVRPDLKSASYRENLGDVTPMVFQDRPEFEKENYLKRATELYDDVRYSGLAAMGLRLPTDSLRRLYVPAEAEISADQSTSEALQRAVDEYLEAMGFDSEQRSQLEAQFNEQYAINQRKEAGAARRLYQNHGNVLVLGDPGSGKTCFAKFEVLTYCRPLEDDNSWYESHVPIFIPLADISHLCAEEATFLDICSTYLATQRFLLDRDNLEDLLNRGCVAIFFDGLDEISSLETRQSVSKLVSNVFDEYATLGNRFVITSRPAAVQTVELPNDLKTLHLKGLTDQEIRLLATRILSMATIGPEESTLTSQDDAIVEQLLSDCADKPGIQRLARNPLLLTLLVLTYANSGSFSAKRHIVYDQATRTLISVRHRSTRTEALSEQDLRTRLGVLALAIYDGTLSDIPIRSKVVELLSPYFNDNIHDEESTRAKVSTFLRNVAEQTGLLRISPRSRSESADAITFMHHSFLEYYAALGLLARDDKYDRIRQHAKNSRWREVITLMCGIQSERDDLTDTLRHLSKMTSLTDKITISQDVLAYECALESDVPSENTQNFLADTLEKCITDGPGRRVAEVREELAQVVSPLIEISGSRPLSDRITNLAESNNIDVAAAAVDFIARLASSVSSRAEFIKTLEKAFTDSASEVREASFQVLITNPETRTKIARNAIRRSLDRGSFAERLAALRVVNSIPGLANEFKEQLMQLVSDKRPVIAAAAARAILTNRLDKDSGRRGEHELERCLRAYMNFEGPHVEIRGAVELRRESLNNLLGSPEKKSRIFALRMISILENDQSFIHQELLGLLEREPDHEVLAVILKGLAMNPKAVQLSTLSEIDRICDFVGHGYRDVRINAVRVLKHAPSSDRVIDCILDRYEVVTEKGHHTETSELIRTLSSHAKSSDRAKSFLIGAAKDEITASKERWTERRQSKILRLLSACQSVPEDTEGLFSKVLFECAVDYRTPQGVRKSAIRAFGAVASPTKKNTERCVTFLQSEKKELTRTAYRAAEQLTARARKRSAAIQAIRPALNALEEQLVKCWGIEFSQAVHVISSVPMRDLRDALIEVEQMRISYDEFSQRMSASSVLQKRLNV